MSNELGRNGTNAPIAEGPMASWGAGRVLMLVGAGAMAEGYLDAAQRADIPVAVVEAASRLDELRARYSCIVAAEAVVGPVCADESWVPPAMALFDRCEPKGILGFAEPHALAAAMVQSRNRLPGPGLGATVISRNKALQRGVFERAGLGQPIALLVDDLGAATEWARDRFPVVVKSLSRMGSAGVERVDNDDAWAHVLDRRRSEGALLVEEYVDGPEFSIEGLVRDGVLVFTNLTRKETTGPPSFVEMAHMAGHWRDQSDFLAEARRLCASVVSVLDVGTGMVHLEFKARSETDLAIIEVAVRTPGDHLMEIISLAHEFDLYQACIDLAMGETPTLPARSEATRSAGVVYFAAPSEGVVAEIDISEWSRIAGLTRSYVMADVGDKVRPPESSSDRLGYGVLDCADPATLLEAMTGLRRHILVTLASINRTS